MSYLYILQNSSKNYYIGITNLTVEKRLKRHNNGDVFSTKFYRPWRVIYKKYFPTLKQARISEKRIKSWKGGNAFKKFLLKIARSSNGRTAVSETVNLGIVPHQFIRG